MTVGVMKIYRHSWIFITILFFIECSSPLIDNDDIHVRKGIWGFANREYKFNDVSFAGFVTSFPWYMLRLSLPENFIQSAHIEYWIYTSTEDAELAMVERLELSNLYMRNMIDFPLPRGPIGNNCWHQFMVGAIQFIRDNVLVFVEPASWDTPVDSSNIELVARQIDAAIINTNKVFIRSLVPAPVVHSIDIISSLPDNWGQSVKVKVKATDPKSQKLTFRQVGTGFASTNDNGIFTIMPDNAIPASTCEDPDKFKIMIWVWNEDHLVSLAEKNVSFGK
jgi:hypothetical protein